MKRFLLILAALAVAACSPKVATNVSSSQKATSDIVILYDNDVHCHTEGYPKMAAMKEEMKRMFDHVALVSSGDFMQGGAIGAYTNGEAIMKIMNAAGYDVVTLGNHEFDYGFPQLYSNLGELKAKVVDCNLIDLRTGRTLFDAYTIMDFGGTKVGFFGISTPNSINSSTPTFFTDEEGNFIYGFCTDSLFTRIQSTVDEMRAKGADYVIALSHIGIAEDIKGLTSFTIASQTSGIDVILDGHSHTRIPGETVRNKEGRNVIVTQTGSYMENLGRLTISPSGEISTELIPASEYVRNEERTAALVDSISADYARFSNRLIAMKDFPMIAADELDNRPPRYMEMPLGNLCTDAFREISGADIAVQNGGTIRAGLLSDEVLFNDIFTMLPFGNMIQMAEVPGSVILDALEYSVYITPESFGGFLQVSGIRFEADLSVPSPVSVSKDNMFTGFSGGQRRIRNVRVLDRKDGSYKDIEPDKMYKVVSSDYILTNCGNGYTMFQRYGKKASVVGKDVDVLERYLRENLNGIIPDRYRESEGRITLISPEK